VSFLLSRRLLVGSTGGGCSQPLAGPRCARSNQRLEPTALRRVSSPPVRGSVAARSRDAAHPANGAADCHPPVLGRFAPSNTRLQRTSAAAGEPASAVAADPQRRWALPMSKEIRSDW